MLCYCLSKIQTQSLQHTTPKLQAITFGVLITQGHVKPFIARRFFGADTLADATSVHVGSLHGAVLIIHVPIDSVTVHFSKYKASIVR